jgi:hypothetical protein
MPPRCADASAGRACQRASWNDSGSRDDTPHARRCTAASQRPGGAKQSAHRGGGTERRVLEPLARPITRLEAARASASPLASAPAAQPPPRWGNEEET